MGNSFGCSASGERLVSAARDGDLVEAKMLLECNPCLAKYSTFGGLNSPLHFAAAKGHNEVYILFSYVVYVVRGGHGWLTVSKRHFNCAILCNYITITLFQVFVFIWFLF